MKLTIREASIAAALLAVLGAAWAYRYTYPGIEPGSSSIGVVGLERQWWRGTSLVSIDADRDGAIESRLLYPDATGDYSPHQLPLESWEDLDRDGRLEVHVIFEDNHVSVVEIDEDGDGHADRALAKSEAIEYLNDRRPMPKSQATNP